MVRANDYVGLEKAIENKKNLFNYCINLNNSVISTAIEVRALECFNLLINTNELNPILQSENPAISGLAIAVDYYLRAPYNSNKYYLEKLLEKSVNIVPEVLGKCIGDQALFQELVPKIKPTYANLLSLITKAIGKSNGPLIKWLYDFICANNLDWYNELTDKNKFNDQVLKSGIVHDNCEVIEYLKSVGHKIQFCQDGNKTVLSLEYAMKKNSLVVFNYFYEQISQLNQEQLSQIFSNKKIDVFINNNSKVTEIFNEQIKKLLNLPIPWENVHVAIANLILDIYNYEWYQFNCKKLLEYTALKHELIYILGKSGKANGNPYDILTPLKSTLNQKVKSSGLHLQNNIQLNEIKLVLKKNKYLLNFFQFTEPESFSSHWALIFNNTNYQIEFEKFIKQIEILDALPNTKTKPKTKATSKSKSVSNIEINV